jgi:hypothetical protein
MVLFLRPKQRDQHSVNRFIVRKKRLKMAQLSNYAQIACIPACTRYLPALGNRVTNI